MLSRRYAKYCAIFVLNASTTDLHILLILFLLEITIIIIVPGLRSKDNVRQNILKRISVGSLDVDKFRCKRVQISWRLN